MAGQRRPPVEAIPGENYRRATHVSISTSTRFCRVVPPDLSEITRCGCLGSALYRRFKEKAQKKKEKTDWFPAYQYRLTLTDMRSQLAGVRLKPSSTSICGIVLRTTAGLTSPGRNSGKPTSRDFTASLSPPCSRGRSAAARSCRRDSASGRCTRGNAPRCGDCGAAPPRSGWWNAMPRFLRE
jgi:hypothetical protein